VEAASVFRLIKDHTVTHYCGAPIVHNTLLNAPSELRAEILVALQRALERIPADPARW
jgi:fatty-acyl-CoA synthase